MKKIVTLFLLVTIVIGTGCTRAEDAAVEKIHILANSLEHNVGMLRVIASDQVNGLAKRGDLLAAIKEENNKKIAEILADFESLLKCDFFTILDSEGKTIFRTSRPEQFGDFQIHMRLVSEVLAKKMPRVFFESTAGIPMMIRAAAPVLDENGNLLGIVTGGFRLDTSEWVDQMKELYDAEFTVFAGDTRVATTVRREGTDERAIGTSLHNPMVFENVFDKRVRVIVPVTVVGVLLKVCYIPIFNEGDDKVLGMFFIAIPIK
jgi:methyl-accepting chemotaxis protein